MGRLSRFKKRSRSKLLSLADQKKEKFSIFKDSPQKLKNQDFDEVIKRWLIETP